jgi:hypothetical protein
LLLLCVIFAELEKDSSLRNDLIRRMLSMQRKLEHLNDSVDESKAVGLVSCFDIGRQF